MKEIKLGRWQEPKGPDANGRYRVYWNVRKCPAGVSKPAPVNLTPSIDDGDLSDAKEVERLVKVFAKLNAAHDAAVASARLAKSQGEEKEEPCTFARLSREWMEGGHFQENLTKNRQSHHRGVVKALIEKWPTTRLRKIKLDALEAFVNEQSEGSRKEYKATIRILYKRAQAEREVSQNLGAMINFVGQKKVKDVDLWTPEDRDRMIAEAKRQGLHGLAGVIDLGWLVGHRLSDLLALRHGLHYKYQKLRYRPSKQRKQGKPRWVKLPISNTDARKIEAVRSDKHDYLFTNDRNGQPYNKYTFGRHFSEVRAATKEGGKHLYFRDLRTSLVVRLANQHFSVLAICSITGHAPVSAASIMRHYFIATDEMAASVMRGDFLARGGRIEDFPFPDAVDGTPKVEEDWLDEVQKPFKRTPAGDEARLALSLSVSEVGETISDKPPSTAVQPRSSNRPKPRTRPRRVGGDGGMSVEELAALLSSHKRPQDQGPSPRARRRVRPSAQNDRPGENAT